MQHLALRGQPYLLFQVYLYHAPPIIGLISNSNLDYTFYQLVHPLCSK
jgi:hypothetical protein